MQKLVAAPTHGIIDYAFSGLQLLAPPVLKLNPLASKTYRVLGLAVLALNALTKTPVGIKKVLSFKTHQRADQVLLAGQLALSFLPFMRTKKASWLHFSLLALALGHYLMTDYNSGRR